MTVVSPGAGERPNPFGGALARANSSYTSPVGDHLVRILDPRAPAHPDEQRIHHAFRTHVLDAGFSCVGARAAFNRGHYRFATYGALASPETTDGLAHDLFAFVEEQPAIGGDFTTFVACFREPLATSDDEFERLLWAQLHALHEQDRQHHAWDLEARADPDDPRFAYSFGGRAYFVVGMHPGSSRLARRFAWPTLVFNARYQFERLREQGRFTRLRDAIRARELALQGSLNPNLSDHGDESEARQYSGRPAEPNWRCPFRPGGDATAR